MDTTVSIVRGYGRASTERQVLSCEQQESVVRDTFDLYRRIKPDWKEAVWGGFVTEPPITRVSKFHEREAGSRLIAVSRPGDVIIVSNYDRIFANVTDVCDTLELCHRQHIRLLILDCDIDTTTIIGDFCFKVLALVKELEVKEIRRRVSEMAAYRKLAGLPMGHPPLGWKHVKLIHHGKLCSRYAPDRAVRAKARHLYNLVQEWHVSIRVAWRRLNEMRIRHPRTGRRWCAFSQLQDVLLAVRKDFPLANGSHHTAPIPVDADAVPVPTIEPDDDLP